jgi:hypothetical protein
MKIFIFLRILSSFPRRVPSRKTNTPPLLRLRRRISTNCSPYQETYGKEATHYAAYKEEQASDDETYKEEVLDF